MSDIPGLKLILHNASNVNNPDDPSFPFKLEGSFRKPEFMEVAFILQHGPTEELVVRGMTLEAINKLIEENGFRTHPRLRKLTITGPDGLVEEILR
jgi:hypothetical protein